MQIPRRGSEEGQRVVDAITQVTRDRILARTIEAARKTLDALRSENSFSPRTGRLYGHLCDQYSAISRLGGLSELQTIELMEGRDMAQAISMSERVGRAVLLRLGYQLPEEGASE